MADILEDSSGKGFRIRFGGNRQRAAEEHTGCITCLESCPIGITSNAVYPAISSFKRMISPNSQFKGKVEKLPRQGGLILIYSSEKNPKMKGEPHGIRSTKQDYGQGQIHQKGDVMSLVKYKVTKPSEMASVLTTESVESLDLKVGDEIQLIIKAVHVLPVEP